jgi:hypothetical protein
MRGGLSKSLPKVRLLCVYLIIDFKAHDGIIGKEGHKASFSLGIQVSQGDGQSLEFREISSEGKEFVLQGMVPWW